MVRPFDSLSTVGAGSIPPSQFTALSPSVTAAATAEASLFSDGRREAIFVVVFFVFLLLGCWVSCRVMSWPLLSINLHSSGPDAALPPSAAAGIGFAPPPTPLMSSQVCVFPGSPAMPPLTLEIKNKKASKTLKGYRGSDIMGRQLLCKTGT